MKKNSLLLLLGIFLAHCANTQNSPRTTGLKWDDISYSSIPPLSNFKGSSFGEQILPSSQNLKPYCPLPTDQGRIAACVAWATAYYAYSIEQAILKGWTDKNVITQNAFSPLFIYNQIKIGNCEGGASLNRAIDFLKTKGDVTQTKFKPTTCESQPPNELQTEAKSYRIKDYVTLFSANESDKQAKIRQVKSNLAQKHPVIVAISVSRKFMDLNGVEYWNIQPNETSDEAHSMCVVGYDDARGAFELVNSWGTNWGNKGFIWIKYADFVDNVRYAVSLYPYKTIPYNPASSATLAGSFEIKKVINSQNATSQMVKRIGNYYELDKDIQQGELFQLFATSKTKENYLYVFSISPHYKVSSHFPHLSEKSESPLIPNEKATVIVPSVGKALKKNELGTDYLCILYCNKKLEDYPQMLKILGEKMSKGNDCFQSLINYYEKRMVTAENIHYQTSAMGFSATFQEGNIVPIILKVNAK